MFRLLAPVVMALALWGCPSPKPPDGTGGGSGGGGGTGGGGTGGGGAAHTEVCSNLLDDDGDGFVDCADSDCTQNSNCYVTCLDQCSDGTAICEAAGFRRCAKQTNGCWEFAAVQACTGGDVCSGGTCVTTCTDRCTEGTKACSSGAVVECRKLTTGCTEWVSPVACTTGHVCSGGTCVPQGSCTNQCTEGQTRCTSGQKQTCVKLVSGCTEWTVPAACPSGQVCAVGQTTCATPPPCTQGQTRCSPTAPAVETCDQNGAWQVTQSCPQACLNSACTASAPCTAGAVRCNGNNVEICNSTGTAWLFNQTCNVGCSGGLCTDPCTAGAKRCNQKTPEECNAQGTGWTQKTACTTDCYQGDCILADLIIDGVTQTLEGEHHFHNSVVVKNGGSLRVGPTGELRLQAKTISVDQASNINANDVGDDARGDGSSKSACCTCTYYCTKTECTSSAVGSQYGANGSGPSVSISNSCCSSSSGYRCTGSASVNAYDRTDDLSISEGSKFSSTKGGGLIHLVAESIDVKGQLTANATGNSASGGGIFLAADTITGSGAMQASGGGGSPAGGLGRVKLLRGATNSFSGSVTGTRTDSPMPPLALVSGSHPESTRWYNDGLGNLFMAWSKPYPTVNGYYFSITTDPNFLPSQAAGQGTFIQAETQVINAQYLSAGANYFHIVSVDSGFNVGRVKNTFKMQLNTAPPTVASSSHPSPRTWYQNNAVYLTWTNPQADANFTGFYYVFDKYADTLPDPATATFTTNKQVLLANTPEGIWVFHLLNRDTRNAVTKGARHFIVYVGTEPSKSNVSGSVFDGSNGNAPLAGVSLKVNRGLFSVSTTASGTYTFNNDLYVGTWDLTAEKSGYVSQTKTVTVVAGTPLNENFTLLKTP